MREILYRGKRIDGNKNWVKGSLITSNRKAYIIGKDNLKIGKNNTISNTSVQPIIPETVGEFTGLTDKNGVKIFEGDVVSCLHDKKEKLDFEGNLIEERPVYVGIYKVKKRESTASWMLTNKKTWFDLGRNVIYNHSITVIGNKFDNPELLKTEQQNV